MKKNFSMVFVALMLVMSLVLSACGGNNSGTEDSGQDDGGSDVVSQDDGDTTDEDDGSGSDDGSGYRFGYTTPTLNNPFCIYLENTLRELAEADGHTMLTMDANYDQDTQLSQIEDLVTNNIDLLFLFPVNYEGVRSAIDMLNSQNIPIVNLDTPVSEEDEDFVDVIVKNDNYLSGNVVGKDVAERFPEGAKIAIIDDQKATSVIERVQGFMDGLGDTNYEIVSQLSGEGALDLAMNIADTVLEANSDLDVFFCGNDTMALGAVASIKAAGRDDGSILVYGVDGSPDAKSAIVSGEMTGTGAQSPGTIAQECYKVALQILGGEDYDKLVLTDSWLINADNVEEYGVDDWQ